LVRLQKYLADAGVASRRAAERLIVEGRVSVNGRVVEQLGTQVNPGSDRVILDGQEVRSRRKVYVALHKPRGFICTRRDPEDRRTIGELLPIEWGNLYSVGRLDRDSEGLIFLTNDGEFCLKLTHPRYGVRKRYRVTVEGRVEGMVLRKLLAGVEHEGEMLKATEATLESASNSQSELVIELAEGKNREVRRMLAALGLPVTRLLRTQIGRIKLGELPVGRWRALTDAEVKTLLSNP